MNRQQYDRFKDLSGNQYGFTYVESVHDRGAQGSFLTYNCICKHPNCGKRFVEYGDRLFNYFRLSCGNHQSDRRDLTGMHFGRLIVLGMDESTKHNIIGNRRYICKCTCNEGNTITAKARCLWDNRVASCGCITRRFPKSLVGMRFNRLKVIEELPSDKYHNYNVMYRCVCSCDRKKEIIVPRSQLTSGHKQSCGCLSYDTHTKYQSEIESWLRHKLFGMKHRCKNLKDPTYGGKGVKVCDEWANGQEGTRNFINWALSRPDFDTTKTIDRIDPDGPYAPWNCRWITVREQQNNRHTTIKMIVCGIHTTPPYLAEALGLTQGCIHRRIRLYGLEATQRWAENAANEAGIDLKKQLEQNNFPW